MRPIFIGGTGRSGTTILKRVLSCHSQIVSLRGELRVIVDPDGALDLVMALSDRWSPYNADIAVHRFRKLMLECARAGSKTTIFLEKMEKRVFWRLGLSPRRYLGQGFAYYFGTFLLRRLDQLIEELTYHVTRGSWSGSPPYQLRAKIYDAAPMSRDEVAEIVAQFFHDLYGALAVKGGQTHWLDDTPYNLLHVHEMMGLFPDLRFIHIYRDPRDVLASYRGFSWGGDDFAAIARRLAGIYGRWFTIREQLPPDCYLEVGLEALAAEPTATLNAICEFIGLGFEESLTSISLDKVNAGRWKRDVPAREWEMAEPCLRGFIEAYGYATD